MCDCTAVTVLVGEDRGRYLSGNARMEARSAQLHFDRMRERGEIEDLPDGRIRATSA